MIRESYWEGEAPADGQPGMFSKPFQKDGNEKPMTFRGNVQDFRALRLTIHNPRTTIHESRLLARGRALAVQARGAGAKGVGDILARGQQLQVLRIDGGKDMQTDIDRSFRIEH